MAQNPTQPTTGAVSTTPHITDIIAFAKQANLINTSVPMEKVVELLNTHFQASTGIQPNLGAFAASDHYVLVWKG